MSAQVPRRLEVAIVGAGTAGAAVAIFLARQGHQVEVFERVPDPKPVGAGIMLQPSGLAVLESLGLAKPILESGAKVSTLVSVTHRNRSVLDLAYENLEPGLFGLGLHRGVLFETLIHGAEAERVPIYTGIAIERVGLRRTANGASRKVMLVSARDDAEGERKREIGPYDLVIACDGARSTIRQHCSITQRTTPYPWGALWAMKPDPEMEFAGRLFQRVQGTRNMIGLLPTGFSPGSKVPCVSLFFSAAKAELAELRAAGLAAWQKRVCDVCPEAARIVSSIKSLDELTFASYYDVVMPRWHGERLVFLGDAAHATSPQLGQGANLALVDAQVLAQCLEPGRYPDLQCALEAYSALRRSHIAYYQFATRWLTPFFQSNIEPLGWARDLLMGPAASISYIGREMVRSMAGTKAGILFGRLS